MIRRGRRYCKLSGWYSGSGQCSHSYCRYIYIRIWTWWWSVTNVHNDWIPVLVESGWGQRSLEIENGHYFYILDRKFYATYTVYWKFSSGWYGCLNMIFAYEPKTILILIYTCIYITYINIYTYIYIYINISLLVVVCSGVGIGCCPGWRVAPSLAADCNWYSTSGCGRVPYIRIPVCHIKWTHCKLVKLMHEMISMIQNERTDRLHKLLWAHVDSSDLKIRATFSFAK